jgi:hypothetical protein
MSRCEVGEFGLGLGDGAAEGGGERPEDARAPGQKRQQRFQDGEETGGEVRGLERG